MERRIHFVRHAKSSWKELGVSDHERKLNKRGVRDAPKMAVELKKNFPDINALVASSAKRALETAEYFSNEYNIPISKCPDLYHAEARVYFNQLDLLNDEFVSVMMVGHNPGLTYLANDFSKNYIDNVPTCGIFTLKSTASEWSAVDSTNTIFESFIYPKQFTWGE